MLNFLLTRMTRWFARTEQRRNERPLADTRDLAELERRMRSLERCH